MLPAFDAIASAEQGQTRVRLVIAFALVAYGLALAAGLARWFGVPTTPALVDAAQRFAALYLVQLIPAFALYMWALTSPGDNPLRRGLALANDYLFLGVGLAIGGAMSLPLYAVVVSVTVGYGLRFGERYLKAAVGCAYLTILGALAAQAYGREHPFLILTVLLTVSLVPAYLIKLLQRLTAITGELVDANRAKDRFIATMNHELRNPLNGILGMSALLQSTRQTTEQAQYTDFIHASAQTVANIVQDVLDLAAIEAGKIPLATEDFNLHRLTNQLTVLHGPAAHAKGLDLVVGIEAGTPAGYVGDPVRVSQILSNLVGNAIKFTDVGRVDVLCSAVSSQGEGSVLTVEVIDTGPGIHEFDKARIFEPFEQAMGKGGRQQQGTGLGIPIARSLARAMGGDLHVRDGRPCGTVFTVQLPLPVSTGGAGVEFASNVVSINDIFARHRRDVQRLRIIVVEDQAANRLLLERLLQRAGHQLTLAEDPIAALDRLAVEDFDLVFVDLHMPHLDGIDFIKQLRVMQAGRTYKTPVIVVSGDSTTEAIAEALQAGASEFLAKPVQPARLLEAVAAFAGPRKTARSAEPAAVRQRPPTQLEHLRVAGVEAAFIERYVTLASKDIRSRLGEMRRSVFTTDHAQLQQHAHTVAVLAESIGADAVAGLAQGLIEQSAAPPAPRLLAILAQMEEAMASHRAGDVASEAAAVSATT